MAQIAADNKKENRAAGVLPLRKDIHGNMSKENIVISFDGYTPSRRNVHGNRRRKNIVASFDGPMPSRRSVHGRRSAGFFKLPASTNNSSVSQAASVSDINALPRRRQLYGERERLFLFLRSILDQFNQLINNFVVFYNKSNNPKGPAPFSYIPAGLFISMNLVTLGLFPYLWIWSNLCAFAVMSGGSLGTWRLRCFAITGFLVQLMLPLVGSLLFWNGIIRRPSNYSDISAFLVIFAALYMLLILPQRCSIYLLMGRLLRKAAARWDREGLMASRVMSSPLKLLLGGSPYIQHHINRLASLGMPELLDDAEIINDLSLLELAAGRELRPRRIRGYNRYHF